MAEEPRESLECIPDKYQGPGNWLDQEKLLSHTRSNKYAGALQGALSYSATTSLFRIVLTTKRTSGFYPVYRRESGKAAECTAVPGKLQSLHMITM